MNRFEAGLNPSIKERMLLCCYTSYVDLYDTAVRRENYFNEQCGLKRNGVQRENSHS